MTNYNHDLQDAIKSGKDTVGHEIVIERLPIYSSSRRDAQFTEYTKRIESIEFAKDYQGIERTVIRFKNSKIRFSLGFNKNLGQEILTGLFGRGARRFGLLSF